MSSLLFVNIYAKSLGGVAYDLGWRNTNVGRFFVKIC